MIRVIKRAFRELRKPRPASLASFQRRLDLLARSHLKAGNEARDAERWQDAAGRYEAYLRIRPQNAPIHVQHGNMLGRIDDLAMAEGAFRRALRIEPNADTWLQLGRVLGRANRRPEAVVALIEGLRLDPAMPAIRDALISLDARILAPRRRDQPGTLVVSPSSINADLVLRARPEPVDAVYRADAYDEFRKQRPAMALPARSGDTVLVAVDACCASPARLRSTLISLLDQDHPDWRAVVVASRDVTDHSVAALAASDARIVFHNFGGGFTPSPAEAVVSLSAGTVLDPDALAWLLYARSRTTADAIYGDHDHRIDHWRDGPVFIDPVLHPMPDREDLLTTWQPPEIAIFGPDSGSALLDRLFGAPSTPEAGAAVRRQVLIEAVEQGVAGHLPLVLASRLELPTVADRARQIEAEQVPGWLEPLPHTPPASPTDVDQTTRITVVIPTRDESGLLEKCVRSLIEAADNPDRVSIIVADNRSCEAGTFALFSQLRDAGVEVISVDEPFNWSRINNLMVRELNDGILLFLNNDTRMLTSGWDRILCGHLRREGVGVVGARLLYPDATLQHGGMIFGVGGGAPMHEGVGAGAAEGGPAGRWLRTRSATAVTGAFLAVPAKLFAEVGGFEELTMAVGYSDVDFCLRVRQAGATVLYAADIELTHYESRSRGRNDTQGRVAWDQGELKSLHDRWGDILAIDPGYNPVWSRASEAPFEGFVTPSRDQILDWLDRSAAPRPWALPKAE